MTREAWADLDVAASRRPPPAAGPAQGPGYGGDAGGLGQEISHRLFSAGLDLDFALSRDGDGPASDRLRHAVAELDEAIKGVPVSSRHAVVACADALTAAGACLSLARDSSPHEPVLASAPASGPLEADTVSLGQALADAATIGIVHQRALARSEIVAASPPVGEGRGHSPVLRACAGECHPPHGEVSGLPPVTVHNQVRDLSP